MLAIWMFPSLECLAILLTLKNAKNGFMQNLFAFLWQKMPPSGTPPIMYSPSTNFANYLIKFSSDQMKQSASIYKM